MTSIFVAKLDFGVTNEELTAAFEKFGKVNKVTIAVDKETGKPRGFAFVEMFDQQEARNAIQGLDGYKFNGRPCVVKEADDRGAGKPAPRRDFQQSDSRYDKGEFKPRQEPRNFEKTDGFIPEKNVSQELPNFDIEKKVVKAKKKEAPREIDTADGKAKKPKMNAYKKSGKSNQFYNEDDELDEEINLFGFDEEDEEEDYSKYVVNSDEDDYDDFDENWEDDDDEEDEEI